MKYNGCGEKYNVEKECNLPYIIEAVGKNIKWETGEDFWKNGSGEEYQVVEKFIFIYYFKFNSNSELYTPLVWSRRGFSCPACSGSRWGDSPGPEQPLSRASV